MKPFTKFSIVVMSGALAWGLYQQNFRAEENGMQRLHQAVEIHRMDCTRTEGLADHTWLACRYPDTEDQERGSVWVLHEDAQGEVWISRNGPAMRVVDRYQKLSDAERKNLPRVHTATLEENMEHGFIHLPGAPWEELK